MGPILAKITLSDYSQIAPLSEHIESQYLTQPLRLLQKSLTVTPRLKEDTSETNSVLQSMTSLSSDIFLFRYFFSGIITVPAGFPSQEASVTFFWCWFVDLVLQKSSTSKPVVILKPFRSLRSDIFIYLFSEIRFATEIDAFFRARTH